MVWFQIHSIRVQTVVLDHLNYPIEFIWKSPHEMRTQFDGHRVLHILLEIRSTSTKLFVWMPIRATQVNQILKVTGVGSESDPRKTQCQYVQRNPYQSKLDLAWTLCVGSRSTNINRKAENTFWITTRAIIRSTGEEIDLLSKRLGLLNWQSNKHMIQTVYVKY